MVSRFLSEIKEQPQALIDTLAYYRAQEGCEVMNRVNKLWSEHTYQKLILTGMGSSYFIAQAAASLFAGYGIPAFALSASELLHYQFPLLSADTLLVCISQSGESYEVVQLLQKLPSDISIVAITNEQGSTLAQHADVCMLCKAGREEMTSTKTYISSYFVACLLVEIVAGHTDFIHHSFDDLTTEVQMLIDSSEDGMPDLSSFYEGCRSLQFIARGSDFATAAQSALMFMEATKTFASAMLGGEFRHGPLEMVDESFRGVVFGNSHSGTYDAMVKLTTDILRYGGQVVFVTDKKIPPRQGLSQIEVKGSDARLWAIPAVIPIQMMVLAWARRKGLTPGDFSHGAKVTIVE